MRRGHMNDEAPLGLLGETHEVGKGVYLTDIITELSYSLYILAPTPRSVELPPHLAGPSLYRTDQHMPQHQVFDFDLDLNPDL
jgi:mediator of RNA polymerase II transcription subunit 4